MDAKENFECGNDGINNGAENQTVMINPSLETLPMEDVLFSDLLPFLNWEDLFRLRSTSIKCKFIVDTYFHQLKHIDLGLAGHHFNEHAFKVLTKKCKSLRSLAINDAQWILDGMLNEVFSANILLSSVNLAECSSLNGSCITALAKSCKQLSSLILRNCKGLSDGVMETLITHLSSVQVIDLSSCSMVNDSQLLPLVKKFNKIKVLRLGNLNAVNDTTLLVIARNCNATLEILDVRGCGNITDRGIRMIGEYCQQLKELFVRGCIHLTEYSLGKLRSTGIQIDREKTGEWDPHMFVLQYIRAQV